MTTLAISRPAFPPRLTAWLPLAILPAIAGVTAAQLPAWQFMWLLALAIYAGLKWLSLADYATSHRVPLGRAIGYLLAWPGMDAAAFFGHSAVARPKPRGWLAATALAAAGVWLVAAVAPALVASWPLAAVWTGMDGIAL
jgi:hypothetical protein